MLFICFAGDDHVIEDTLGVRYSLQNLAMAHCQIAGQEVTPKTSRLCWKRPLCVLIVRYFLKLLRHFHLVISLAHIKFAKMFSPSQISKNTLYAR